MPEDNCDLDNEKFTFYGDLLGISNLYMIDQKIAKDALDFFYNTTFDIFHTIAEEEAIEVFLFSDSIFITGVKIKVVIEKLCILYVKLFNRNIFMRGAIVKGKLDFDPRLELKNIKKKLPSTDVLFRAVTLERSVDGMRLLLEKKFTKDLLLPPEWLTNDLYAENIDLREYDRDDFRRRIILSSEWHCYEYLWPYYFTAGVDMIGANRVRFRNRFVVPQQRLAGERVLSVPKHIRRHLDATNELIQRTYYRSTLTDKTFNSSTP